MATRVRLGDQPRAEQENRDHVRERGAEGSSHAGEEVAPLSGREPPLSDEELRKLRRQMATWPGVII